MPCKIVGHTPCILACTVYTPSSPVHDRGFEHHVLKRESVILPSCSYHSRSTTLGNKERLVCEDKHPTLVSLCPSEICTVLSCGAIKHQPISVWRVIKQAVNTYLRFSQFCTTLLAKNCISHRCGSCRRVSGQINGLDIA